MGGAEEEVDTEDASDYTFLRPSPFFLFAKYVTGSVEISTLENFVTFYRRILFTEEIFHRDVEIRHLNNVKFLWKIMVETQKNTKNEQINTFL